MGPITLAVDAKSSSVPPSGNPFLEFVIIYDLQFECFVYGNYAFTAQCSVVIVYSTAADLYIC